MIVKIIGYLTTEENLFCFNDSGFIDSFDREHYMRFGINVHRDILGERLYCKK